MPPNDRPPIVAEDKAKKFAIYRCDIGDHPHERIAECSTLAEMRAYRWPLHDRCKVRISGKFYSRLEFEAWAQKQKETSPAAE